MSTQGCCFGASFYEAEEEKVLVAKGHGMGISLLIDILGLGNLCSLCMSLSMLSLISIIYIPTVHRHKMVNRGFSQKGQIQFAQLHMCSEPMEARLAFLSSYLVILGLSLNKNCLSFMVTRKIKINQF